MTKDEALDLALDALKASKHGHLDHAWADEAITAIKQARSAPVQEPVADVYMAGSMKTNIGTNGRVVYVSTVYSEKPLVKGDKLYTTPPAKPANITGQAPCARHCEATAFQIVIKNLRGEIERLKAAQPAPVVDCHATGVCVQSGLRAEMPAPVQEPVVFYRCNGCGHAYEQVHPTSCDCMEAGGFDRVEYYTTPPAAQRQWVPVTKELLSAQHPWLYESVWIAMKDGSVMSGHYAWMQGRYPDRFLVGDCASLWAFEATHVMPMNQPKHPASEKGQP